MNTKPVTTLRRVVAACAGVLGIFIAGLLIRPVGAVSTTVVISQVYGGGGNAGSTYKNDFIELHNLTPVPVSLAGWSVQYASATGTTWQVTNLNASIPAGGYFLIQEAVGAGGTTVLPTPDLVGTIALSATAGKVALVNISTALSGACPTGATVIDFVGFGATANCFEGTAPTPAPSNTNAVARLGAGDTDTDNNVLDFSVALPNPRNSATSASTSPTGVGGSFPGAVNPGDPVLLTVAVTPGTNPTSAGLTVTADLSSAGGSSSQPLFDNGSNGDVTPADLTFSLSVITPVTPATYTVPFTVSDNLLRSTSGSLTFTVQGSTGPQPIVVSQIYGGAGSSGATFANDYIELYNHGASPVAITGWSVQYTSAAGTSWQKTTLSGVIGPGHYYLVQQALGTGGTPLPLPDATGTIAMSATAGKVALVSNGTTLSGACPIPGGGVIDFVGYGGSASCFEGAGPALAPSSTTAVRRKVEGCVDTDNNSADFLTGAPIPRNSATAASTCTTVGATPLAIHDIQGTGATSPHVGELVVTPGVVTGLKSNGFYLQAPDVEADADPNTSEGVFVFTSSAPPAAAVPGNYVEVTGMVQEFIPSADPNSPPVTEIGGSPTVVLLATGLPLPAPVVIMTTDTSPTGGISQLEKYEGMRVSIPSLTVIAPTQGTVNEANASSTSTGVFYGVLTGLARPFREPGVEVPDPLPPGAPANVPRYDANPERIRVDSDGQPGATVIDVATGAVVTNLVGPLDYSFRTYTVLPDPATPPTVSGNTLAAIPVDAPAGGDFTIASFNMERFFDTIDDPAIQDVALTATAFDHRLSKASLAVRNVLRAPDVIGVEEMENLTTLQAVAARISADALAAGQPDPHYQAVLLEGNDIGGIDVGFLVKTGRVTIVESFQLGKDTTYINPNNGMPELLNDRPSLVLRAVVNLPGRPPFPLTAIVNHLRSLTSVDDPVDGNRVRTKRRAQAEYLALQVQLLQSANPVERIVLVGDFNAFQFNDGYTDVMGTIKGTPTPADEVVLASADLVNPDLIDLVDSAPLNQQYSFVFDGVAQELDHVLVTQNLWPLVTRFQYARNDADFPEVYRNDANRPERISDHDMVVAAFAVPADTTAPRLTVPADFTVQATSPAGAVVLFDATANDEVDGAVPVLCTPPAHSTFALGATVVTCTATDAAHNSATSPFTVTVVDTIAPTIAIAAPIAGTYDLGQAVTADYSCGDTGSGILTCAGPVASGAAVDTSAAGTFGFTVTASDKTGNTSSVNVTYTVRRATPAITWANPADIVYRTSLGAAQLNAIATVPGTFAYFPPSGTVLGAGYNQTLLVTFHPTDVVNYAPTSATVHINVRRAAPGITWANPADIVFGVSLNGAQLNASATVPGTFAYFPPAGTGLSAGYNQTLLVTFHPTDAVNHGPTSATVHINVQRAVPAITWANPADIVFGVALNGAQLNASATVPGTLTYFPPAGTVLGPGSNQTLLVTFHPADAVNYGPTSATVHINVRRSAAR